MIVVMLGAPGAGKGTQASELAARLQVPHVSTGDLFREALQRGTELGQLAKTYMERGALVPDDVTTRMVEERLRRADAAAGAVLDGFPRTEGQARALDAMLKGLGRRVDVAVAIEVPEELLVRRLSARFLCRDCQRPYHLEGNPPQMPGVCDICGGELYQRVDDRPETVRERLATYHRQTLPVLRYYEGKGVASLVDGVGTVPEVAARVAAAVQGRGLLPATDAGSGYAANGNHH